MNHNHMGGFLLVLLLFGTGCVNVQKTSNAALHNLQVIEAEGTPQEVITVSNYGYYLFNFLPLFCGNTQEGHIGNTVWFQNHVTLERTQGVMMREIKEQKPLVTNLQTHSYETCFFSVIPYIGNSLGIVWYKQIDLSAVLVKTKK
jgi:hypothetical protein